MYLNSSAISWTFDGPGIDPAVEAFHRLLPDYNETPLVLLPELAIHLGLGNVLVKDESHRFGLPAFKILGASWAIYRAVADKCGLPPTCSLEELGASTKTRALRLVTCTDGNWGRATGRMAKYLQIPATIFVPNFMDKATQDKIRSEGATVKVVDGDYDASIQFARKEAETEDAVLVMDVSWRGYEQLPEWVVEGYSTMLTETDRQLRSLVGKPATHVIASVGVGSWLHAVCMHYKSPVARTVVVAVEPESAACLKSSLEAGKITPIDTGYTIMNGMCCGTVSYTAWEVVRDAVDASVTVSDKDVHHDLQYLHSQGVKNGPCGAAPLSALRRLCEGHMLGLGKESVVVLFSTEGAREYVAPA
ncbi:tryptophan synthase beta subunit-like PLP-dependent enzyme [Clohesyomyces aquaticus]|uniref:Tryptophan synthase beta subunit-like PLP-dependent enzyme n=1 Tax=Clohesyomyces aquaticus TaxID=1231657 RepID=A0A1Y1ZST6_9PLEO|nr:tryptophan synthase beta subunit-like PLP-dependent enzyme [Clohesyomyces aquaticus]